MWLSSHALLALALLTLRTAQALSITANRVSRVDTIQHIDFLSDPDSNDGRTHHDVVVTLARDGRRIRFGLAPNLDILAPALSVQHVQPDGSYRDYQADGRQPEPLTQFYKGSASLRNEGRSGWTRAGWARLSIRTEAGRRLLEGAFRLNGDNYHIATDASYRRARHADDPAVPVADDGRPYLVVWRDSDIVEDPFRSELLRRAGVGDDKPYCGTQTYHDQAALGVLAPRQMDLGFDPADTIGSTDGCPTSQRVALLGIATDCTYTREFQDLAATRRNIISQINIASELYESSFNVRLAIQNLTISDPSCPARASSSTPWNVACTSGFDISARLSTFSEWRGQFDDSNAIWTLLSACNTGRTVGIAWLRSVCSRGVREQRMGGEIQYVASTNVVVRTRAEWQVIAHEIGHNFGATHDCTSTECDTPGGQAASSCCPLSGSTCDARQRFLMNPVTNEDIEEFSGCSIGLVCTGMGRNLIDTGCFVSPSNAPSEDDISESECGNGIVEGTEACDCGGPGGCPPNSCCNPDTCQLRENASCDPTNDKCCTDSCQVAESGFVCRESTGQCDPQETCDGRSATCPGDDFATDGDSCGEDGAGLACASGQCTSRDRQCTMAYNETVAAEVDACDLGSCRLSCELPSRGCQVTEQLFLDGTPCAGGGMCMTGTCERAGSGGGGRNNGGGGGNGGGGNGGGSWIDNNRNLVIGLAAGIGGLIVIIILACMISSFRKKRNAKVISKPWPTNPFMAQHLQAQQYSGQQQWQGQQGGYAPQWPQQGGGQQQWQPPPNMVRYG